MSDNPLHDYEQAREEAVEAAGFPADFAKLSLEEQHTWIKAARQDIEARLARRKAERARSVEILELSQPVTDQYPDIEIDKVPWLLPEPARGRLLQLLREVGEA